MKNGFVCLNRRLMESPIWGKPPYYFKIYAYFLMQAAFASGNGFKRGELVTTAEELEGICSSGKGGSKQGPARRDIYKALHFMEAEESHLHVKIQSEDRNKIRVTLLQYDKETGSKQVEGRVRGSSGAAEKTSTIIYNKENKINHINKPQSRVERRVKPSKFNNFSYVPLDNEAVKAKGREKLKRLVKEMENHENISV